ncbi:MAG: hypothetical protein ACOYOU_11580 [Kiritimatiellia bacterium]
MMDLAPLQPADLAARAADAGGRCGSAASSCSIKAWPDDRIADIHLMPDPDPHRRTFFGVYRLTAKVRLVDAHVRHVATSQPPNPQRLPAQSTPQEPKPGFVQKADDFAEQHEYMALALTHDRVNAQQTRHPQQQRHADQ